ncbi:MAG: small, acid-soluble spore protein, alpha/beta type [Thermincolia bacterium]
MTRAKTNKPNESNKEKQPKPLSPMNLLKLEVAEELGLMDKVKKVGWAGLTASETGRIGGIMTRKLRSGAFLDGQGSE